MTDHIQNISTLLTFNECRLYLHFALAKHPIEPMEKNRLAAALAFLNITNSAPKLQKHITTILDEKQFCDVIKLAKESL
jgi:hypothetical protein